MKKLYSLFSLLIIFTLTFAPISPAFIASSFAEENVATQDTPTPPPAATPEPAPSAPLTPVTTPQAAATPKVAATPKPAVTIQPKPSSSDNNNSQAATPKPAQTARPSVSEKNKEDATTPSPSPSIPVAAVTTGGKNGNSQTGDSSITTGDANVNGSVVNGVNTNITEGSAGGNGSTSTSNSGNGTDSNNNANSQSNSSSEQQLQNSANLSNDVQIGAVSGGNTASRNTGDGEVVTGDANIGVTVINGANNNVSGLAVNQYDVDGNQSGDIVLGSSTPTVSCGNNGSTCSNGVVGSTKNSGNGSSSTNNANSNSSTSSAANLSNNADVVNDVVIDAVTGHNNADSNVGEGSVTTGDANVAVTVLNFLNNNIVAGTVDVINIFGEYVGNIILPTNSSNVAGNNSAGNHAAGNNVSNNGNGDSTDNNASANSNSNQTVDQANLADIDNSMTVNANTGENSTKSNTNGSNNVKTGNTSVDANVYNITNVNSKDGGYIVLVNDNGVWRGTIYGANGTTSASEGIQFTVQPDGSVVATNQGNGESSKNNASTNATNTSNTTQSNTAKVQNNVTINADTGHNSASRNTGGGSISTGNVNVGASIMNFVNNNFIGQTFRVVLVNVMGKWTGSVVPPGAASPAHGGSNTTTQNSAQASTTPQSSAVPTQAPSQVSTAQSQGSVLGTMQVKKISSGKGLKQSAEITLDNGQKFYVDDTLAVPQDKPIVAAAVGINTKTNAIHQSYWLMGLGILSLLTGASLIAIKKRKIKI